jgi:hypothetical protein
MQRTSIGLPDDDYKKIQALAEEKSIPVADYIRHLIHLGLKVEEAAKNHSQGHSEDSASPDPQKKLLTWGLESRYLLRYLIQNGFQHSIEQRNAILTEAAEKAASRVEAWLNAENNDPD